MGKKQTEFVGTLFPEYEKLTPVLEKKAKKKSQKQELLEKIAILEKNLKEQQEKNARLAKENEALKVKAEAFDGLMSSNSLFPTTVVAKSFGWSAIKLNQYLKQKKIQYQQGDVWVLYTKYANKGYTRICWYDYATDSNGRALSRAHTYWTSKGILFIRELLKNDGLLTN